MSNVAVDFLLTVAFMLNKKSFFSNSILNPADSCPCFTVYFVGAALCHNYVELIAPLACYWCNMVFAADIAARW